MMVSSGDRKASNQKNCEKQSKAANLSCTMHWCLSPRGDNFGPFALFTWKSHASQMKPLNFDGLKIKFPCCTSRKHHQASGSLMLAHRHHRWIINPHGLHIAWLEFSPDTSEHGVTAETLDHLTGVSQWQMSCEKRLSWYQVHDRGLQRWLLGLSSICGRRLLSERKVTLCYTYAWAIPLFRNSWGDGCTWSSWFSIVLHNPAIWSCQAQIQHPLGTSVIPSDGGWIWLNVRVAGG